MNRKQKWTGAVALVAGLAGVTGAKADCDASKGGEPTSQRFELLGDTVRDKKTGLEWMRCSVGQTWKDGEGCAGTPKKYSHNDANEMSVSGYRMPTLEELKTLIATHCKSPVIDDTAFPGTPPDWYHSSTKKGSFCWFVGFKDGEIGDGPICDSEYLVRMVKAKN